ncbi:MAG: hypothetical protein P8R54_03305 [Myxococcota bacterium]|nr:hypothetical protein [Myxococcota bacterium]
MEVTSERCTDSAGTLLRRNRSGAEPSAPLRDVAPAEGKRADQRLQVRNSPSHDGPLQLEAATQHLGSAQDAEGVLADEASTGCAEEP